MKYVSKILLCALMLVASSVWGAIEVSDRTVLLKECPGFSGFYGGTCPQVLLETGFEVPDWTPTSTDNPLRCETPNDLDDGCDTLPEPWNVFYSNDFWNPDTGYPTHEWPAYIGAGGRTGNAYVSVDESHGSASQWGAEGQLGYQIPGEHSTLYVSFWFKFSTGYQWESAGAASGQDALKFTRVATLIDRELSHFSFGVDNNAAPIIIFDFKYNGTSNSTNPADDDFRIVVTVRCAPVSTYICNEPPVINAESILQPEGNFELGVGDGEWHHWESEQIMSSAAGVADGEIRVWIDGVLQKEITNARFVESGSVPGWNFFSIAGNAENIWDDEVNETEQEPLYYDDVTVTNTLRCLSRSDVSC